MRKPREPITSKLNLVGMTLEQLKREGKGDNWSSIEFWARFMTIRDFVKKSSHKKLQEILS